MGNTYKTVMIYVSTFKILNTVVVTNKISSVLQKLSKLLSLPDQPSISKFLFYLILFTRFSTLPFCPIK